MGSAAENFDAYFKSRLEHYEESPNAEVWENISEKLGHTRKKRLVLFITRIAAGMIITLTLSLGYYYFIQQRTLSVKPVMSEKQKVNKQQPTTKTSPASVPENTVATKIQQADNRTTGEKSFQSINNKVKFADLPGTKTSAIKGSGLDLYDNTNNTVPVRMASLPAQLKYQPPGPEIHSLWKPSGNRSFTETDLLAMNNLLQSKAIEDHQKHGSDWVLGGQIAPLYSYRNLNSDYLSSQDKRSLNNSEKGIVAYAGGIAVTCEPSRRFSVQTGLYYSKYGQEKTEFILTENNSNVYYYSWGAVPISGNAGNTVSLAIRNSTGIITNQTSGHGKTESSNTITGGDNLNYDKVDVPIAIDETRGVELDNIVAFQYFEYLEIPLILKYKLIDKKMDVNLLGGLSTNFLLANSVQIDDNGNNYNYGETVNISKVNYSSSVGIGFEYPVSSNLLLSLEPKFRYYLNPIDKNVSLNVFPYSIGVFAGISYVF
jgi:hypothetical protein